MQLKRRPVTATQIDAALRMYGAASLAPDRHPRFKRDWPTGFQVRLDHVLAEHHAAVAAEPIGD